MLTHGFTVFHKDSNLSSKLGRGFVVGTLEQVTKIQTQGTTEDNGVQVPAIIENTSVKIHYQVLWENARTVSPSLHSSTELVWEMLMDEYLDMSLDDEEEEEGEVVEEEEDGGVLGFGGNETEDDSNTTQN